jgi:Ca2+-transporting ATPase
LPLLAVQILWMNLATDPLIGMALALDAKEPGLLDRKYIRMPKYFISGPMLAQMVLISLVMSIGSIYAFSLYYRVDYARALTITLTTLSVYQWYNGFNCQFPLVSIFSRQIFRNVYLWLAILANFSLQLLAVYNPSMQKILKTVPMSWGEWVMVLGLSFTIILAEEARKWMYRIIKEIKPFGSDKKQSSAGA